MIKRDEFHGDEVDRANETAQMFLDMALRQRKPPAPEPTGYCLNCDEPIQAGRWCDANCRDDWEKRERAGR